MIKPASRKTDAWMSMDEYLIAFYPEDAFNEAPYTAQKGYEGSSKDHFYTNSGLHRLGVRHLRCMCTACVTNSRLYSESCDLTEWCGSMRHYNLKAGTVDRVRVRPRREIWTLEEFAATLSTQGTPCERVVACMVHEDDGNELEELFYLARVVGKARCIDTDCLVAGNEYHTGDLVVNMRWYCYLESSRGDRIYRLQPGSSVGVVYSVKSIVKNITGIQFKSYSRGKYTLGRESVTRLINYLT